MSLGGIIQWLRKFTGSNVYCENTSDTQKNVARSNANVNINKVYLNDATTPQFIIDEAVPKTTKLGMRAVGEQGGGFPLGSIQQQAMALKQIVNDSLVYMTSKTSRQIKGWSSVQSLILMARAGKDVNAYYDRGSLRFFYFGDPVRKKNVFCCDSRSVVTHEFGHAYLDILRPDWWDIQSLEVWAFHEAFGDIVALLSMLQYDQLIDQAIKETKNDLTKSNILTRLAADMGIGLYNMTKGKQGELPYCLRDLSIKYNYVPPETLPSDGRDDQLLNEPHSFSRVFSGSFYQALIQIAFAQKNMSLKEGLKQARDIMCRYLIKGICSAPTNVRLFEAIVRQMMQADQAEGGKYQKILNDTFGNQKIIQQQVKILEDVDFPTFVSNLKNTYEIQTEGQSKVVRTLSNKTLKLTEKFGIMALEDNPLLNLEIVVPDESAYYFDENDKLVDMLTFNEAEVIDAAFNCLSMLHNKNLVGTHNEALFEDKNGKLLRRQIVCRCNKPNYCDPNAPEYGKPWKPKNNSGCVGCKGNCQPQSCDCEDKPFPKPPKTGCFTRFVSGGVSAYRTGSRVSRKVC